MLPFVVAAWTGCNRTESLGTISGKVTFQGEPVSQGFILFDNQEKGVHAVTKLQADGSFQVETASGPGILPGTYRVAIMPPKVEFPIDPTAAPPLPKEVPNIPLKYRDPQTSKVTFTVKEGANRLDIDMRP